MNRAALKWLHWGTVILLLVMIKGGTDAAFVRWAFGLIAVGWALWAMVKGVAAKPGPKLTGVLRRSFRTAHIGLYGLVGLAGAANLAALLGWTSVTVAWNMLLVLLAAGTFHGIFHMWRHTALMDGALRMMTPTIWHKHL